MFTAFSIIILPLCVVWFGAPAKLIKLMLIVSVFEAAAALVLGSFGVQPGLVPALAFMAYVALQMLLGVRFSGTRQVLRTMQPLILVTIWAVLGAYAMPHLFVGQAYVWPQKQLPPFTLVPLAPTSSNINQMLYVVIDCALAVMTAIYLTRPKAGLGALLTTYFASGLVVAAVAVWQFGSKVAGLPFPDSFFYSNPGWAILTGQSIGRVPRINGPFSEPAALAGYMGSIVCATGWIVLQGNATKFTRGVFLAGLFTMMLSTSTSGFATLAIAAGMVVAWALITGSGRLLGAIARLALPLVLVLAVVFAAAGALVGNFQKNVSEVVTATLNKQESSSYADRTSADLDSFKELLDTGGLGVGWGSNRSSSLLPGLSAGLGVPGVLGLLWFGAGLTRQVRATRRSRPSPEQLRVIDGCCGGLVGFLLSALLAGPTISSVTFYLLLGMLTACITRVGLDKAAGRRVRAEVGHAA